MPPECTKQSLNFEFFLWEHVLDPPPTLSCLAMFGTATNFPSLSSWGNTATHRPTCLIVTSSTGTSNKSHMDQLFTTIPIGKGYDGINLHNFTWIFSYLMHGMVNNCQFNSFEFDVPVLHASSLTIHIQPRNNTAMANDWSSGQGQGHALLQGLSPCRAVHLEAEPGAESWLSYSCIGPTPIQSASPVRDRTFPVPDCTMPRPGLGLGEVGPTCNESQN